jgi:hypothetical protein
MQVQSSIAVNWECFLRDPLSGASRHYCLPSSAQFPLVSAWDQAHFVSTRRRALAAKDSTGIWPDLFS